MGVPVAAVVVAKVADPVGVEEPVHQRVAPHANAGAEDDASVVLDDVANDAVEPLQRRP